jgi:hypothetical protein
VRLPARLSRVWATVRRPLFLLLISAAIITSVVSEAYSGAALRGLTIRRNLGGTSFDFVGWELDALGQKANAVLNRPGAGLSEAGQMALVRNYFTAIARIGDLTREIARIHADPNVADPVGAAASLETELASLREQQASRRPAVERILERQTSTVLAEEGLATLGTVFPPVQYQFTESPNLLVVSPRERIVMEDSYHVDSALPLDAIERIEADVARDLGASTLIEETGGISTYPTMVIEERNLEWVLSTIAHEWAHTYLFLRPLGRSYFESGSTRTLNETVASIVGDEIARRVLLRYYPEMVRPEPWPMPLAEHPYWWAQRPGDQPFEFGPFMRETRLEVDRLLAEGKVEEAEAYMDARREVLVENGYNIRKLNQAYFAFHGSYAVGPAATDPIGAKLRALRLHSGSLAEFVRTVAAFTGAADLDAALTASP